MLADHPAKGLESKLEVVADARELSWIEPFRLEHLHDLLEIALHCRPVELIGDTAREVSDLEEVHQPLEAGVLAARADGHLHLAALPAQEQLGHLVEIEVLLVRELIQHLLHLRVLGTERLLEPFAERFEVEEVEVEDAVERGAVARLLDQRRCQRGLERFPVFETELRGGRERVQRLGRRDADLRPAEVADELEDPLVHVKPAAGPRAPCRVRPSRARGPFRTSPAWSASIRPAPH